MSVKAKTLLLASVITCFLIQAQGADKYTDGNRPYEFGFSIDGEQHRHEKKDEKGLIEGEFGFITADGVYHVTVYATDEQGRFKILSMKNIRVKPYPTYTAKQSNTSARQGHSLDLPAEQATVSSPVATTTLKPISIGRPVGSCSSCSIPTTSTAAPVIPESSQPLAPNQIGTAVNLKFPQGIKSQSVFENQPNNANVPSQQGFGAISSPKGSSLNIPNYSTQSLNGFSQAPLAQDLVPPQHPENPQNPQQGFSQNQNSPNGFNSPPTNFQGPGSSISLQSPERPTFPQQQQQTLADSPPVPQNTYLNNGAEIENSPNPDRGNVASGRTPKRLDNGPSIQGTQPNNLQRGVSNDQGSLTPTKPTLISAQMQIVDKNTDIYRRGPGENEGLPEGLTTDDMSKLLYTFNYTVGFHGHFEEGYTNGVKQGYYFITGRNGVRTRVDYTADSTGFHPKISQEVLDLLSDDVPKPETEKEEKYGLKGYEFKWLYYPVEAKGR